MAVASQSRRSSNLCLKTHTHIHINGTSCRGGVVKEVSAVQIAIDIIAASAEYSERAL